MNPFRDVAVIVLAIEALLLMLIPLIITFALAYGVHWLRHKLSSLFEKLRHYVDLFQRLVERGSAAVVAPLIAAYALAAQLHATWNALTVRSHNIVHDF